MFAQELVGARPGLTVEPRGLLPGTYNFLPSADRSGWRSGVRAYAEVVYRDVWEGVDWKLARHGPDLEQEFIVKPGADPDQIQVAFRGIEGLRVGADGSLLIRTAFGELRESSPRIYQDVGGTRVEVAGRFKLRGERAYGFELGPYERRYALVIDPTLVWSTYLGGSANENADGTAGAGGLAQAGIAVDVRGHPYVTGSTYSTDFPSEVPYQGDRGPLAPTAFVTKLGTTGSALVYSTYLGTASRGNAIAVDAAGAAFVTGQVGNNVGGSIPTTTGAADDVPGVQPAFATKLAPDGQTLEFSTYIKPGSVASGNGIAVDPDGNAYVAGDLGGGDGWARKLNPTGTAFLYSATFGGSGNEWVTGIALDGARNAYIAGSTASVLDFPTTPGAYREAGLGAGGLGAFVVKLDQSGAVSYATLLAGDRFEEAFSIAADATGHAYVTGYTRSTNFPTTPGAFQTAKKGGQDAFVTKLLPDGSGLVYSTYLGGSSKPATSPPAPPWREASRSTERATPT